MAKIYLKDRDSVVNVKGGTQLSGEITQETYDLLIERHPEIADIFVFVEETIVTPPKVNAKSQAV